jgi:large subunit ribosomal protein L1
MKTKMKGKPENDVQLKCLYPRQIYEMEKGIHLLKMLKILDFINLEQDVYLDLTLDMALEKRNKVEPFASVSFPYPFASEINKVTYSRDHIRN